MRMTSQLPNTQRNCSTWLTTGLDDVDSGHGEQTTVPEPRTTQRAAVCATLKADLRARDISSSCNRKASARSGSIRGWLHCRWGAAKSSSGGMGFRRPSLPCSRVQQCASAAGGRKSVSGPVLMS